MTAPMCRLVTIDQLEDARKPPRPPFTLDNQTQAISLGCLSSSHASHYLPMLNPAEWLPLPVPDSPAPALKQGKSD